MRVKVIGIGGIGGCLLPVLCKFLNYYDKQGNVDVVLVDGDAYESDNAKRQFFNELGNKAEVTAARLGEQFPNLHFEFISEYIDENNEEREDKLEETLEIKEDEIESWLGNKKQETKQKLKEIFPLPE